MRVLLDEMLPIGLRDLLPGHEVVTAAHAGLTGLSNGELIARAVALGFQVLVTLDVGIQHQQNLVKYAIGFVLISENNIDRLRPFADRLLLGIADATPGQITRVGNER